MVHTPILSNTSYLSASANAIAIVNCSQKEIQSKYCSMDPKEKSKPGMLVRRTKHLLGWVEEEMDSGLGVFPVNPLLGFGEFNV